MSSATMLERFMTTSPVVPVVVIDDAADALPLAEALLEGGVAVIEVTLRSEAALRGIEIIAREVPEMLVAVGTALNERHLRDAQQAGAKVAISPGLTDELLHSATALDLPILPGIATPSDLLRGLQHGLQRFKLFPATAINALELAKAFAGPFPGARFCPTGGITLDNAPGFLALPNIDCVGASWLGSREDIRARRWADISHKARKAMALRP